MFHPENQESCFLNPLRRGGAKVEVSKAWMLGMRTSHSDLLPFLVRKDLPAAMVAFQRRILPS
jgi:hypothetical protein